MSREKTVVSDQKQVDEAIQTFQKQKQHRLNQVHSLLTLKLSQIQCLEASASNLSDASTGALCIIPPANKGGALYLPNTLQKHVVFTQSALRRLSQRIQELQREKSSVRTSYRELQQTFRAAQRTKQLLVRRVEELHQKYESVQLLRFGQVVDLDALESSTRSESLQKLQAQLEEKERGCARVIRDSERKFNEQQVELRNVTRTNTALMVSIATLGERQLHLDQALSRKVNNFTVNDTAPTRQMKEKELLSIRTLLDLQKKQIKSLQMEINLFKKKGGHIYTALTVDNLRRQLENPP